MPVRKISIVFTLLLILIIAALATYLVKTAPEPVAELQETKPVIVAVVPVEVRDIQPMKQVSGRLQAATKLGLHFEVGGRVIERNVEPGQRVKAGDLLLALAEGDYHDVVVDAQAQLDQERAAIARDRRLLAIAQKNSDLQAGEVKRLERLSSSSLAAQSLLDDARKQLLQLESEQESLSYSVSSAQSRIALRESALRRAQRNQQRTQLNAPFDSVINSVEANVGDFVTTAQVVVEVFEQGQYDLAIEVDGETARAVSLKQIVDVTIDERVLPGEVVALQNDPDPETFTHAIRIRISEEKLLPGTLAGTTLVLSKKKNVLVAPVTAILQEEGAAHVYRVVDNVLMRVAVDVGIRHGDVQIIAGKLQAGDIIVSRDVAALSDNQIIVVSP